MSNEQRNRTFWLEIDGYGVVDSPIVGTDVQSVQHLTGTRYFDITFANNNEISEDDIGSEFLIRGFDNDSDGIQNGLYFCIAKISSTKYRFYDDKAARNYDTDVIHSGKTDEKIVMLSDRYRFSSSIPEWVTGNNAKERWLSDKLSSFPSSITTNLTAVHGGIASAPTTSISLLSQGDEVITLLHDRISKTGQYLYTNNNNIAFVEGSISYSLDNIQSVEFIENIGSSIDDETIAYIGRECLFLDNISGSISQSTVRGILGTQVQSIESGSPSAAVIPSLASANARLRSCQTDDFLNKDDANPASDNGEFEILVDGTVSEWETNGSNLKLKLVSYLSEFYSGGVYKNYARITKFAPIDSGNENYGIVVETQDSSFDPSWFKNGKYFIRVLEFDRQTVLTRTDGSLAYYKVYKTRIWNESDEAYGDIIDNPGDVLYAEPTITEEYDIFNIESTVPINPSVWDISDPSFAHVFEPQNYELSNMDVTISNLNGYLACPLYSVIIQLLTTTKWGNNFCYNENFERVNFDNGSGFGLGIPGQKINLQSFLRLSQKLPYIGYNVSISIEDAKGAPSIKNWLENNILKPFGLYLYIDKDFRLSLGDAAWSDQEISYTLDSSCFTTPNYQISISYKDTINSVNIGSYLPVDLYNDARSERLIVQSLQTSDALGVSEWHKRNSKTLDNEVNFWVLTTASEGSVGATDLLLRAEQLLKQWSFETTNIKLSVPKKVETWVGQKVKIITDKISYQGIPGLNSTGLVTSISKDLRSGEKILELIIDPKINRSLIAPAAKISNSASETTTMKIDGNFFQTNTDQDLRIIIEGIDGEWVNLSNKGDVLGFNVGDKCVLRDKDSLEIVSDFQNEIAGINILLTPPTISFIQQWSVNSTPLSGSALNDYIIVLGTSNNVTNETKETFAFIIDDESNLDSGFWSS